MIENLIVGLIVCAAAWFAGMRFLPARWIGRKKAAGCGSGSGSGCDSCNSCDSGTADVKAPMPAPTPYRVIKLHAK